MRLAVRLVSVVTWAVGLSAGVAGCGGSTDDDEGSGASRGGAPGAAGTVGNGGTGNSGNAGAGARSGSGPGGVQGSSGDSGRAGGENLGGETNTGEGGAAGGEATAGAGGATQAPPELVDRCDTLCTARAAAECSASQTATECALGCRLAVQRPECATAFEALFECTEEAEFVCDDSGQATPQGCERQYTLAMACLVTNIADPELEEPCADYCAKTEATECPAGGSLGDDCAFTCQAAGGAVPACAPLWKQFLTCTEDAPFACGEDGTAAPQGCELQVLLYAACLFEGAQ